MHQVSAKARLALALGAALLHVAPAEAQCASSPGFTLDWQDGVLGSKARCLLEGPAGKNFILIPSPDPGPTALSTLFPGDPRFMCVGFDNQGFWRLGKLQGKGNPVIVDYMLPLLPAFAGMTFYAQAATFPGPVYQVDQISNPVSFRVSLPEQNHPTVGPQVEARSEHTATRLPNGRIFLAGGLAHLPGSTTFANTWELFDPLTESFLGGLAAPYTLPGGHRRRHTATLLDDGRVLLAGGVDTAGDALATTEIFDPMTGMVTVAAPMAFPRVFHTATLLPNGSVLVVGGTTRTGPDPLGFPDAYTSPGSTTLELYVPTLNLWINTGQSLPRPLMGHRSDLLPGGMVFITGGVEFFPLPDTVATVRVYNAATNMLTAGPPLPQRLAFHNQIATLNGELLVAGGAEVNANQGEVNPTMNSHVFTLLEGAADLDDLDASAWNAGPGTGEDVIDGEVICIANGSGTEYIIVSGYEEVDPNADLTFVVNRDQLSIDASLAMWVNLGPVLADRPEGQCTGYRMGDRYLISGAGFLPGGGIERRGEIHVRTP